ncbi:MAG: nitroreductase family protein [Gammaproteobacteria bacterium]|nr:nitroreductase family protein [Gammaproteobacteria bacterium]
MPETTDGDDSWLHLESVDHVLSTARSVRRKLDFSRPVEPEVLFECINVSTQAPTGIGGESWRFVVVTEAEKKQRLAEVYRTVITDMERERGLVIKATQRALMDRLHEIPAMIFVCTIGVPPGPEIPAQVGFYGSVLPSAWSLMLALRARNLGSTWTSLLASRQEEVGAILEVPDGVILTVMLPVGYMKGAKLKKADRMDARQVTFWNQWGNDQPL